MDLVDSLARVRPYIAAALTVLISLIASGHVLLYKRDTRAAVLWVGFIWLVPVIGAVLYLLLGINRIRRRAVMLRQGTERFKVEARLPICDSDDLEKYLPAESRHLTALGRVATEILHRPLVHGNQITPLLDGDEAYPAMLQAIANAKTSITLSTYIFDRDDAGIAFAMELGDAVRRGVEVRVLIDATGTRYSWPPILGKLRRERVRYARFLPAFPLWRLLSMNLRSHRKILVVDGRVAFTGGMNIRIGHWLSKRPRRPVQDLHFRVEGPIVAQLQECFADDWLFTTRESLRGDEWFPPLEKCGPVIAGGITDGPDEDFEKLRWIILGAIAAAKDTVRIVTPYFLPDAALISALNITAMRGVAVDVIVPAKGNLPFVQWASCAHWWQILKHGCRIWLAPPPFDHSKLMIVDGCWSMIGSANWDPRSLRLNFEFNIECYGTALAQTLETIFQRKLKQASRVTLESVDSRSLPLKLLHGSARLLTPFL